ncbi:MAG: ABC transporter substrate-binding protein [Oscillospiraceae bacterium]|nr:ABC transporter substrate-binding protein [Oscillospiraceae bacterium]
MKVKRLLALALVSCLLLIAMAACASGDGDTSPDPGNPSNNPGEPVDPGSVGRDPYVAPTVITDIPRTEVLYINGLQWGPLAGWNPFSSAMNNALAITQDPDGARMPMFEAPYMYNILDNKMYPLLASGGVDGYTWNADGTELSYKIKAAAYWSDGTKVTAHDAAFTWSAGVQYSRDGNANWKAYIADVVAQDDETVVIKAVMENGKAANPLLMVTYLGQQYILQKAWLEKLIDRNGGDVSAIADDTSEDVVWSGPYTKYFADDTKIVLIRDDDYWGQHSSMWGKLPTPKYLSNVLYENNAAGDSAISVGEVDVSQQFIANVHLLWEELGLPISTYIAEEPYFISANMPTAYFNMNSSKPGLDNPAVRKAIAIAVDYDLILANAMTNQSPSFKDVPRSLMNPLPAEQAMYDRNSVSSLQWVGNDIEGAKKLLDDAGILIGDSGYREIDGQKLSYTVSCPSGWSDWEAAMHIVADAGEAIGIEMVTFFPDWSVYQTHLTSAFQDEYDIFMFSTQGISPAQPWSRIRALLSTTFVGTDGNWGGNFGQYVNDEVDQLIAAIPQESDSAKLKEMYTRLVEIYLTEVPSFSLMYRPEKFHIVNESVWTGFTEQGDGRNVPPVNCISGYAIADLYNLRLS